MQDISCIIDQKSGKPACPMQNVEISAVIGSMIAEVTLVQNYANIGRYNIEAVYIFPLPHNAQVTGFKGRIGKNEVTGEFREKNEAFAEYEKAVRRGDSAFLLESHRPDIFRVSLGNIAPGEKASISITYLEDIEAVDGELRWIIPTVLAPRYNPKIDRKHGQNAGMNNAADAEGASCTQYVTPPFGETSYTLKIKAALRGMEGIRKVSSPSHPVEVMFHEGDVDVSLAKETELLDSDFILSVLLDEDTESKYTIAAEKDASGAFGAVRLLIDTDEYCETQKYYNYIFMIDISGSMTGEKLKQAKRALAISLRNLVEGDFFNIIAFEGSFQCFSNEAMPYSQQNLEKADKWIVSLNAAGGTEIYNPLRFVLEETAPVHGLERIVLLFTDGQVGNENEIINLVKAHNQSLQFFPFGIDTAVNKLFIDGLASAGNGMPEYIYPGERIEDKVIRQFSRIHQPYLANPTAFDKNGEELETVPLMPARIYISEAYSFMVKSGCLEPLEEIRICGTIGGKKEEILLKPGMEGDARLLGLKWAKCKIELLEEQSAGNNQRRNDLIKEEIVELSLRYSLLSTMTSLVAVYRRKARGKGIPETIVVPVAKPRGWDMFDDTSDIMYCMAPGIVCESSMRFERDEGVKEKLEIPAFFKRSISSRANNTGTNSARANSTRANSTRMGGKALVPKSRGRALPSVDEIIRKTAQSQKADGTFGSDSTVNCRTAFYIIGMLLLIRKWRPYHIQIRKAGEALIKSDLTDLFLKSVALHMLREQKLLRTREVSLIGSQTVELTTGSQTISFTEDPKSSGLTDESQSSRLTDKPQAIKLTEAELQTIPDDIAGKLSGDEKTAYEAFKSGNLQYLCDIIGYKYSGSIDKNEFAYWLLTKAIEQG